MEYWKQLSDRRRLILAAAGVILLLVSGWLLYPRFSAPGGDPPEIILPEEPAYVTVYVTGMVWRPGVYTLRRGSRILDAIRKAGGPRKGWDPGGVNLAKKLADEDMVAIPGKQAAIPQEPPGEPIEPARAGSSKKKSIPAHGIAINEASQSEWETLPGIGPSLAMRIVRYRNAHGGFKRIEDLRNVEGFGEKKLKKIRTYLHL